MERRGERVLDHLGFGQIAEGGMQLLEVVEVVEDRLDHGVDHIVRNVGRGDEGGADAEGLDVGLVVVHPGRNGRRAIVGILVDQPFDRFAGRVHEHRVTAGQGLLGQSRGMADQPEVGIDLVVAERLAGFGGLQLGRQLQVVPAPAHGRLHDVPGAARAGPGVADVDPLALEVGDVGDPGVAAGQNGDRLGMDREHRAEVLELALVLEFAGPVEGVILPVGLRDTEFKLAGTDGVDVVDRAARRLRRAADAVGLAVLVDQSADRAAGRIVHAGDAARADRDEPLFGRVGIRRGRDEHHRGSRETPEHSIPPKCC